MTKIPYNFKVTNANGDDVQYNGVYLDALSGIMIKARILKILAPILTGGLQGEDDIIKGIALVVQDMDEEKVIKIIMDLVRPLQREGFDMSNEDKFNQAYHLNTKELYKAFFQVISINFKDLIGGKLQGITEKLEKVL